MLRWYFVAGMLAALSVIPEAQCARVSIFPENVTFSGKGGCRIGKYCPDNTCEKIESCTASSQELRDVFFLYLVEKSDYSYLEEWKQDPKNKANANSLLDRLGGKKCALIKLESEKATCALKKQIAKGRIKFYFERADEGEKATTEIKIQ